MGTLIEIYFWGCFFCVAFSLYKLYKKRGDGTIMPTNEEWKKILKLALMSWYGFCLAIDDKKEEEK